MPKNRPTFFGKKVFLGPLDLALLLYTSPLPPSATLKRLGELFEVRDSRDVLEVARRDEVSGGREGLRRFLEEGLAALKVEVETSEAMLQQLSELMMLFTTTMPLIVVGLIFMISPGQGATALLGFSLAGMAVGVAAQLKVPRELRFPPPDWRAYALLPLAAVPFLLDSLRVAMLGDNVFLLAAIAAAPASILVWLDEKRLLGELGENGAMLVEALRCPFHLYRCVPLERLEAPVRVPVSRVVRAALRLMGRFGAEREALQWLTEYYEARHRLIRDVRSRTAVSLLNGVVGVAVLAVGLSMLYTVFSTLPPVSVAGVHIDPRVYGAIKPVMNLVLAINAASYSAATASLREGNPLYMPLYLPAMLLATYAGLALGPLTLPAPG